MGHFNKGKSCSCLNFPEALGAQQDTKAANGLKWEGRLPWECDMMEKNWRIMSDFYWPEWVLNRNPRGDRLTVSLASLWNPSPPGRLFFHCSAAIFLLHTFLYLPGDNIEIKVETIFQTTVTLTFHQPSQINHHFELTWNRSWSFKAIIILTLNI